MKILFSFVLIACCVVLVPAQERVMEKAEFDKVVTEGQTHRLKWAGEKYRMTVTTSSKAIGRPQTDYSSKMIIEYGPSMETRTVNTSMFGQNPAQKFESMRLGNWVYRRSEDGPWTRKEYAESTAGKERQDTDYPVLSSKAEYRYLGEGKLMDKRVQIFFTTERQTRIDQKTGDTRETESKTTYWVDETGLIVKSDFIANGRGKVTTQTSVVFEYQLDPSITFIAPEIAP
jgi:hypothetical protein